MTRNQKVEIANNISFFVGLIADVFQSVYRRAAALRIRDVLDDVEAEVMKLEESIEQAIEEVLEPVAASEFEEVLQAE